MKPTKAALLSDKLTLEDIRRMKAFVVGFQLSSIFEGLKFA